MKKYCIMLICSLSLFGLPSFSNEPLDEEYKTMFDTLVSNLKTLQESKTGRQVEDLADSLNDGIIKTIRDTVKKLAGEGGFIPGTLRAALDDAATTFADDSGYFFNILGFYLNDTHKIRVASQWLDPLNDITKKMEKTKQTLGKTWPIKSQTKDRMQALSLITKAIDQLKTSIDFLTNKIKTEY